MPLSVSPRRIIKRPTTGSERVAKRRQYRTALFLGIAIVILTGLMIGLGYLYAWYSGSQIMPNTFDDTATHQPVEIKKPVTRTNQRVSVAVSSLSSPITPGETAQLSIRTNIDAICQIEVLAGAQKVIDKDLGSKAADEFGIVSWNWAIPKDTRVSSWPITVTCNNREFSGVVKTNLVVTLR